MKITICLAEISDIRKKRINSVITAHTAGRRDGVVNGRRWMSDDCHAPRCPLSLFFFTYLDLMTHHAPWSDAKPNQTAPCGSKTSVYHIHEWHVLYSTSLKM